MRLILATRNAHKTREFAQILGAEFVVSDFSKLRAFAEVEEIGDTFEANAIIKAIAASRVVQGFVVADDSGLVVPALRGEPGVRSARYAGERASDQENVAKLLKELEARRITKPDACFSCALALARNGKMLAVFHGRVDGVITDAPRGENGFGYDPVFVPIGFARTFAELGDEIKNRMSHRARAIAQLREYLLTTR
ncbi:MAG: RdgB/HAM1 family non-canonical purine NTP pyrophosphatase [Chthoniobacterales bacterium]